MSWFNWPDGIKKRACRYLLQRYLGQFLQEKLTLDQLSVDLYNGKGRITDVCLDVTGLNELGETFNLPIQFVDGFISSIEVAIPWSKPLTDNSMVEVDGLLITVQPKQRTEDGPCPFRTVPLCTRGFARRGFGIRVCCALFRL
ncbi:unnamed protein product, partial [Ixodes pacificus]